MACRGAALRESRIGRAAEAASRAFASSFTAFDVDETGEKPKAMPLLLLALGLWAGCAVSYAALQGVDGAACLALSLGAIALSAVLAACGVRQGMRRGLLVFLGVALGASLGAAGAYSLLDAQQRASETERGRWVFEALSDARQGTYRASVIAQATNAATGERFRVEVALPAGMGEGILHGFAFAGDTTLTRPADSRADYCWREGVEAACSLSSCTVLGASGPFAAMASFRASAISFLGSADDENAALAQALVCGFREPLRESELYRSFKAVGLAHLVAVSGAHLSIVCGLLASLLGLVRCPRAVAVVAQSAFVLSYLFLAAAPISAIRASIMTLVGLSSFFARRRSSSVAGVGLCVVFMLVCAPKTAVSISFFLSAASTLGIIMLSALFESWFTQAHLPRALASSLALTMSASVATTPYSAALFSQLPLVAPLANIVAAPLFTVACAVGLAGTLVGMALPSLAPVALGAVLGAARLLALAVEALACLPYASLPVDLPEVPVLVASLGAALALWLAWPKRHAALFLASGAVAAAAVGLLLVVAPRFAPDEIVMLDVGQGDAFLVRSEGACVLIDTGNNDQQLLEALARHGAFTLDAVLISHADDDHCASLSSLRGVVNVRRVGVAGDAITCPCASCSELISSAKRVVGERNVIGLECGDAVVCGGFTLRVIAPERFVDEGGNADSVCLLAALDSDGDGDGDWTTLFCGDAESEQLAKLVEEDALGNVDVYKVGHHGSRAAITPELAVALSPSVSLVSVGAENRYGHPVASTLKALEDAGSRVFRTDESGDVSCEFSANGMSVRTLR